MGWEKEIVSIDNGEQQKTETKHKKQAGNFNMIFLCKGQYRKEKEKKKNNRWAAKNFVMYDQD